VGRTIATATTVCWKYKYCIQIRAFSHGSRGFKFLRIKDMIICSKTTILQCANLSDKTPVSVTARGKLCKTAVMLIKCNYTINGVDLAYCGR
jgi:hypothetical protein